jgi:hypothetical protein
MGRIADAIAQLELALKLDPTLADVRENLTRLRVMKANTSDLQN